MKYFLAEILMHALLATAVVLQTGTAQANDSDILKQVFDCKQACYKEEQCQSPDLGPPGARNRCYTQCNEWCIEKYTETTLVRPKYRIIGLLYAPPGCGNSKLKCGSSSNVSYNEGSSAETQTSISSSFTNAETVSMSDKMPVVANGVPVGNFTGTINEGFTSQSTTKTTQTLTKSRSKSINVPANGDGIDHLQDVFLVLLNPAVVVKTYPGKTTVSMGFTGDRPHVAYLYGRWVLDPSTMDAGNAALFAKLGFVADDYAEIAKQNPFLDQNYVIDTKRYAPVDVSFTYQAPLESNACFNGVCSCISVQSSFSNAFKKSVEKTDQTSWSVGTGGDLQIGPIGLKVDDKLTFTQSQSESNTKSSSNTATATINCPAPGYLGPQFVDVFWDTVYGSFAFVFWDPEKEGAKVVSHGLVVDRNGKPKPGVPVDLLMGKVHQRTFSAADGAYTFYLRDNATAASLLNAHVSVGHVQQTVKSNKSAGRLVVP